MVKISGGACLGKGLGLFFRGLSLRFFILFESEGKKRLDVPVLLLFCAVGRAVEVSRVWIMFFESGAGVPANVGG